MKIRRPISIGPIAIRLTRGETAARLFLGVRLQCARCHNHPYDRWTQDDYYNWAAVFGRIDYQIVSNQRRDRLDKHEFNGEQIVLIKEEGEVQNARTGQDAEPKFLGGYSPAIHPIEDRLVPLAEWLTTSEQRAVRQVAGQFRLVSLAGPRPGRADRRFSRHQSAEQSGAARCAGPRLCGQRL